MAVPVPRVCFAARASGGRGADAALSFQALSPLLSWLPSLLFDAADRSSFVCSSSPRLCQIKGQRLGGEATLLFILVQPRERSNKSRGNVVTREAERSLPTGRAKWREAPSLKSLLHIFAAKCHFPNQVREPTLLRSPLIRSLVIVFTWLRLSKALSAAFLSSRHHFLLLPPCLLCMF